MAFLPYRPVRVATVLLCRIFLFGARPPDASLIPGKAVPEALVRALQALSDPTRLRILYYLNENTLSPTELSRRLRLRTPTVLHHLNTLRLAGLVQVTLKEGTETKTYTVRAEAVAAAFASLQGFLQKGGTYSAADKSGAEPLGRAKATNSKRRVLPKRRWR